MVEIKRQLWHANGGFLIAIFAYFFPKIVFQASIILTLCFGFVWRAVLIRKLKIPFISDKIIKFFGRKNEVGNGTIYFLIGCLIVSLFFSTKITIISILVLSVSDALSTIIGANFGKHKLHKKKTLEGSTAFFVSSFLIIYTFYGAMNSLITSIILTLIELYGEFDDNIVIPPISALSISLLSIIF